MSAQLGYENPGEYTFINRGIGGDRSIDILARIKKDAINLKPDYMSIFVGVVLKYLILPDKYAELRAMVEAIAKAAKRTAEKYNIKFVPLMKKFDDALKYAPVDFWTADGVHPKAPGHELIKREWIKAFNEIK